MEQRIAEERIRRLFELADRRLDQKNDELADRYIELARDIGMKYNVSMPGELKKRFCSECGSFLRPGYNCQVRIDSTKNTVKYRCSECGEVQRYGY